MHETEHRQRDRQRTSRQIERQTDKEASRQRETKTDRLMCDTVADAQQQHKRQRSLSDWMVSFSLPLSSSTYLSLAAAARTLLPPPIAGEIKRKTSGSLPHRKLFLFFVSQSSDEAQPTCHLMTFCIDFFPQLCDMWKHFSDSKAKYYYYENVQFCNKKEMTK